MKAYLALAFLAAASSAHSATLLFTGTFTAPYNYGTIPVIQTSFQFTFNDNVVAPAGSQAFHNIPLSGFSMVPAVLGTTSFTTANTGASLFYSGSTLAAVTIGGLVDGSSTIAGAAPYDDFYISQILSSGAVSAVYKTVPTGGLGNGGYNSSGNLVIEVIPEPASLAAFVIPAVVARRRRGVA